MYKKALVAAAIAAVLLVVGAGSQFAQEAKPERHVAREPMLAHNVFFTLKDDTAANRAKLVEGCHKYLKDHPGVLFFGCGTIAEELNRPVNDRDFDVSLSIVFANAKAQDDYQKADPHLEFIKENSEGWAKVRVFDSLMK